eukprot:gnl/Hemi2/8908_TR3084_c0_g1_i1.p3 gnl/Hemi2/8908_TR3084_c0_g1~~gnl/Hemi2/8908_TR3084_c0_g1_i1.p3  ORF type:complete len:265 (+),score=62.17 gnl/Hemi2/8908_TR3084_c0_g1_i1:1195-1989(+)
MEYKPALPAIGVAGIKSVIFRHHSNQTNTTTSQLKLLETTGRTMSLFSFFTGSDKKKTFRPKKKLRKGSKRHELHNYLKTTLRQTLGSGNLREAVRLPPGEDLSEWLAVNTVDFFNQINLLYGSITEFCNPSSCPIMSAGPAYEYFWADGQEIKKAIPVSAPQYVDYLMSWIQNQLDDESLFPSQFGVPFPPSFRNIIKNITKRLFRVYAHIYHSHFDTVVNLGIVAHLNTCFKHFAYFIQTFDLVERKELEPLKDLIDSFNAT